MDTGNHLSITGATLINGFVTLGGAQLHPSGKTVVFSNSTIAQSGSDRHPHARRTRQAAVHADGNRGQTSWPVAPRPSPTSPAMPITTVTCLETSPPVDAEF